jgi:hypothetical protein
MVHSVQPIRGLPGGGQRPWTRAALPDARVHVIGGAASGDVTGGGAASGNVTGGGAASWEVTGGGAARGDVTGGGAPSGGVTGGRALLYGMHAYT